VILAIIADS